jgi:hypothetical protein
MKTYWGDWMYISRFSAPRYKLEASHRLHPLPTCGERATGANWLGAKVGSGICLVDVEKWIFFTLSGLKLRPLGCQLHSQSLYCAILFLSTKNNKLRGLYSASELTDWETATCWRNLVPTFADREVSRGQRGGSPKVVNFSSLDRSRNFSFK